MPRRHELTDAQRARVEDLLPGKKSGPGRTAADNRRFVNAVVYVLKTGAPWADLPGRSGKHDTARKRFDRWCASRVWARVAGAAEVAEVQLDATAVKAYPVAATGRRQPRGKKRTRTSAGARAGVAAGRRPRPHAAVGRSGRLLRLVPTPGQPCDASQAAELPSGLARGSVGPVIADAAYDGGATRRAIHRRLQATTCIRPNPTRKRRKR